MTQSSIYVVDILCPDAPAHRIEKPGTELERAHKHTLAAAATRFAFPSMYSVKNGSKTLTFLQNKVLENDNSLGTVITLTGISISKNQKSRLRYRIQINRTIEPP